VRAVAVAIAAVLTLVGPGALTAWAADHGPDGALCQMDTRRVTLPSDFFLRVCFDGQTLVFANDSEFVLKIVTDPHRRGVLSPGPEADVSSSAVSMLPQDLGLIPPEYLLKIPVSGDALKVTLAWGGDDVNRTYAIGRALNEFTPGLDKYALAQEIVTAGQNLQTCKANNTWVGDIGCRTGFAGNVGFAAARYGVTVSRGAIGALVTLVESARWTDLASSQAIVARDSTKTFTIAAAAPSQPPAGDTDPHTVRFDGIGPLALTLTADDLTDLGYTDQGNSYDGAGASCVSYATGSGQLSASVESATGRVLAVRNYGGDAQLHTKVGNIRVGSTLADVREAFAESAYRITERLAQDFGQGSNGVVVSGPGGGEIGLGLGEASADQYAAGTATVDWVAGVGVSGHAPTREETGC
jgi:hypothetical protein